MSDDVKIIKVRGKLLAHEGDFICIVGNEVYVHPAEGLMDFLRKAESVRATGRAQLNAPARAASDATTMNGPMLNRLDAKAKPNVALRAKGLYAIVAREPGQRATDYYRLLREQAPELKLQAGVMGRQAVQRALHVLVQIQAIESDGSKHPAYRVI